MTPCRTPTNTTQTQSPAGIYRDAETTRFALGRRAKEYYRWWVEYHHGILFVQAEDGIRDYIVTGVQTCALPIFPYPDLGFLRQADAKIGEHATRVFHG